MNLETLYHHDLKRKKTDFSFSIEEENGRLRAVADCYKKRIENGTAKKLKARD